MGNLYLPMKANEKREIIAAYNDGIVTKKSKISSHKEVIGRYNDKEIVDAYSSSNKLVGRIYLNKGYIGNADVPFVFGDSCGKLYVNGYHVADFDGDMKGAIAAYISNYCYDGKNVQKEPVRQVKEPKPPLKEKPMPVHKEEPKYQKKRIEEIPSISESDTSAAGVGMIFVGIVFAVLFVVASIGASIMYWKETILFLITFGQANPDYLVDFPDFFVGIFPIIAAIIAYQLLKAIKTDDKSKTNKYCLGIFLTYLAAIIIEAIMNKGDIGDIIGATVGIIVISIVPFGVMFIVYLINSKRTSK